MNGRPGHERTFQHGLATCCAAAGGLLLSLYTSGAPTNDIRARVPFLLGPALTLEVFCIFIAVGLLELAFTRGWSRHAVYGVVAGAVVNLAILQSGILQRVIPEFREERFRWSALGIVVLISVAGLVRLRRLNTDAQPSP